MKKNKKKPQKTPEEWKLTGNSAFSQHDFSKAIECYTEAHKLDPTNGVFLSNRAAALIEMGDYRKAAEDCIAAIPLLSRNFR